MFVEIVFNFKWKELVNVNRNLLIDNILLTIFNIFVNVIMRTLNLNSDIRKLIYLYQKLKDQLI